MALLLMTVLFSATAAAESYKVVYSIPGLSAPIWTAASEGFKDKAAELGWEAEILDPTTTWKTRSLRLRTR